MSQDFDVTLLDTANSASPPAQKKDIFKAWDGVLGLPQESWNLFFAFLVISGQVGQNVSLPIWFASVPSGESLDPMFVLIFAGCSFVIIFAIFTLIDIYRGVTSIQELKVFSTIDFFQQYFAVGFCNGINGVFLVFAASKTAPFLQAILGTFNILWTIIFRFIILRKYPNVSQVSIVCL